MNVGFPRPGPALLGVMIAIGVVGVLNALALSHADSGGFLLDQLACAPIAVMSGRVWQIFTAGFVTVGFWHLAFTLLGLYFFSTDLEQRWGVARYLRFLGLSIVTGYALAVLVDRFFPFGGSLFHPASVFGAEPAITAMVLAWTMRNPTAQIRLFFFLPLTGQALFWITLVFCFAGLAFPELVSTEGAIAPLGGVITALAMSGTASPLRTVYLKTKLAILKQRAKGVVKAQSASRSSGIGTATGSTNRPTSRSSRSGGPPLRVVYGGLEEELRNRKPPKDKRDLN